MTPLQVELLSKADTRSNRHEGRHWAIALTVLGLAAAGYFGARGWIAHREAAALASETQLIVSRTQAMGHGVEVRPARHLADAASLARAGAFDIGQVLANLESVREPGVRLRSLDVQLFDATAQAQFEVDALSSLSNVMAILAESPTDLTWQIVSAEAPRDGGLGALRLQARRGSADTRSVAPAR